MLVTPRNFRKSSLKKALKRGRLKAGKQMNLLNNSVANLPVKNLNELCSSSFAIVDSAAGEDWKRGEKWRKLCDKLLKGCIKWRFCPMI